LRGAFFFPAVFLAAIFLPVFFMACRAFARVAGFLLTALFLPRAVVFLLRFRFLFLALAMLGLYIRPSKSRRV
jgi:hypothetical protein